MNAVSKLTTLYFSVALAAFIFTGCSESLTAPDADIEVALQPVPVHPSHLGLAKTVFTHQKNIDAISGGILGGANTGSNYVEIPPQTLPENLFLEFEVLIRDVDEEITEGRIEFTVRAKEYAPDQHIYFQPGKTCKVYVSKEWLAGQPEYLVNLDSGTVASDITETETHWVAEVSSFSTWSWYW